MRYINSCIHLIPLNDRVLGYKNKEINNMFEMLMSYLDILTTYLNYLSTSLKKLFDLFTNNKIKDNI